MSLLWKWDIRWLLHIIFFFRLRGMNYIPVAQRINSKNKSPLSTVRSRLLHNPCRWLWALFVLLSFRRRGINSYPLSAGVWGRTPQIIDILCCNVANAVFLETCLYFKNNSEIVFRKIQHIQHNPICWAKNATQKQHRFSTNITQLTVEEKYNVCYTIK